MSTLDELLGAMELCQGSFVLQPVVLPSVAWLHSFARELGARQQPLVVVEPHGSEWMRLSGELERRASELADRSDWIAVFGEGPLDPDQRRGLSALNRSRDRVARALRRPLLWCGSREYHLECWQAMPDLWSVRAAAWEPEPSAEPQPRAGGDIHIHGDIINHGQIGTGRQVQVNLAANGQQDLAESLVQLLDEAFTPAELRRFLRGLPLGAELLSRVAQSPDAARQAVDTLSGEGAINEDFFSLFARLRPRRAAAIGTMAEAWSRPSPVVVAREGHPIRILHLSDLHFSPRTSWEANPILESLVARVATLREAGLPPDLIAITGDIAHSGRPAEYDLVERWLRDRLLPAAALDPRDLLMVPGNHDVDRQHTGSLLVRALEDALLDSRSEQDLAEVLGDPNQRRPLLARLAAWVDFANRFRDKDRAIELPWWSERRTIRGVELFVAGLCTTWTSRGDRDQGRLLLGSPQVHSLTRGAEGADLAVALAHHPLSWLADWDALACTPPLRARFAALLRGHQHEADPTLSAGPNHALLDLAAGAAFEGARAPLGWQLLELDPFAGLARVHLQAWEPRRFAWVPDRNRVEPDGVAVLPLRRTERPPPAPPLAGPTIEVRATDPLDSFKAAVRMRADSLSEVFRAPSGPRALSAVWVEVRISEEAERTHLARDRQAVRRIEEIPDHLHRRWVLLGEPGSGKTTLLHHLALELLAKGARLPVLLEVGDLDPAEGLAVAISRSYGHAHAPRVMAAVARGAAVLLLDGLDEALDPAAAMAALRALAAEAGDCPLIVGSRTTGYQRPAPDFAELVVRPLEEPEQRALLLRWVPDEARVDRNLQRMRGRLRLRRIVENPLLLTLAGLVMRDGQEVPERRSGLYRLALDVLLKGEYRGPHAARLKEPTTALRLLGRLALAMHGTQREVYPTAELHDAIMGDPRSKAWVGLAWEGPDDFLTKVATTTGLLVPDTRRRMATGYVFPHRTFREYLAATALSADLAEHGIGEVAPEVLAQVARGEARPEGLPPAPGELGRVLAEGRERPATWSEVLALTCGLQGEGGADALVRRVAGEGQRELLLRVVAEAEGISGDTVTAALAIEQGGGAWGQRKQVLDDLGALVPDPATVVSLLVRFAEQTTHGADRYWVREHLRAIGRGDFRGAVVQAEVARSAAAEAGRLLDGVGDVVRFRKLVDGRWRPIPAGWFRMGSTKETDPDRYEREGPQHPVHLVQGFQMLQDPVTNEQYECFDPGHRADRAFEAECGDTARHPVVNVTWYEAALFAEWASAALGARCRLPAETEWEYACRGAETLEAPSTRFWAGSEDGDLEAVDWVRSNSEGHTHAVDELPNSRGDKHPFGLRHLHGNAWEWCADWLGDYQPGEREHDPAAFTADPDPSARRSVRGGGWGDGPRSARSACRVAFVPDVRGVFLGFRLVLVPGLLPPRR